MGLIFNIFKYVNSIATVYKQYCYSANCPWPKAKRVKWGGKKKKGKKWKNATLDSAAKSKRAPYHHLIPFETYSEWIDFEPVWIIYEIAENYISDYRIQVEFHSSQPMNFLSNTDPPSIPDFFFFKSKKQNQEKTMEKIKLHVNVSHAYVAEVWTCSL